MRVNLTSLQRCPSNRLTIKMASCALDPNILPAIAERKGTLFLRSDHMKYGRATLNSNWHADREAEPKDYDVCAPREGEERDLLKATYHRIGNITDGTLPETTTQEAMYEVHKLKKDCETRHTHQAMVAEGNFYHASSMGQRDTGKPERGYDSILPRHRPEHSVRHLETTQRIDYVYPYQWTPKPEEAEDLSPEVRYRRNQSEFTDTADHRRKGVNTWQDCPGTVRDYSTP